MWNTLPLKVLLHHRNAADREVTSCTTTNLEETDTFTSRILLVPINQEHHGLDTILHDICFQFTPDNVCSENIACSAILKCRNDNRNVLLASSENPTVLRIDLVIWLHYATADDLINILVREIPFTFILSLLPNVKKESFKTTESLFLRDASICNTIVMVVKKLFLLLRSQVPIARNPVVV